MIGLLFLGVLAFWCLVALAFSLGVLRLLSRYRVRWPLALLIFAGMLVLPLADDISGGREFAALCKAEGPIAVDRERAAGRSVYVAVGDYKEVPGPLLPVYARQWDVVDVETGERVFGFRELASHGGWLSEVLRFSETAKPFTFDSSCDPGGNGRLEALFRELHLTRVKRPEPEPEPAPSS